MTTPLQQDVCDVMESLDNIGALFLLTVSRHLRTKTGRDLAQEAYAALLHRAKEAAILRSTVEQLAAEVDGLRAQNARMTDEARLAGKDADNV